MVWDRLRPLVPVTREQFGNPRTLGHLESAAKKYEKWYERRAPGAMEKMRAMLAAQAQAARQQR